MTKNDLYKESFKTLLESIANDTYIGEGNPNANILILGKESTNISLSEKEMGEKNFNSWTEIIKNDKQFSEIKMFEDNPLFPWKGQKFGIRREAGKITGEHGTAPTWFFYQLLIDMILEKPIKTLNDFIDFHEYCFHSELNQINAKRSDSIPKESEIKRIESIKKREKLLFTRPFYQGFQIVIIACGHYSKKYNFDIENTFKVKWQGSTIDTSKGNWFNIHYNLPNESPKIVIHTRQFSNGISKKLIEEIAEECRNFMDKNNIQL